MFRLVKASMLLILLVCIFLLSVPMVLSAEGAREIELGEAFPQDCTDCHGSNPEYPLLGIRTSYEHSGHNYRSNGIHNAKYAIQILYDSIEVLDKSVDTSSRRPR